jgi:hypothetical protein
VDIANNLIEKHETSAAAAIINPIIVFLIEEDRPRLPKNGGSEEGWDQPHILWGKHNEVSYIEDINICIPHPSLTLTIYLS